MKKVLYFLADMLLIGIMLSVSGYTISQWQYWVTVLGCILLYVLGALAVLEDVI